MATHAELARLFARRCASNGGGPDATPEPAASRSVSLGAVASAPSDAPVNDDGLPPGCDAVCVVCGRPFRKRAGNAAVCGSACAAVWERMRQRAKAAARSAVTAIGTEGTCPVCGGVFVRTRQNQVYCGADCRHYANDVPLDLTLRPRRRCHDCGKPSNNYRCAECLARWRVRHGVSSSDVERGNDSYAVCL